MTEAWEATYEDVELPEDSAVTLKAKFDRYAHCFMTAARSGSAYWVWKAPTLDPKEITQMLNATYPFRLRVDQRSYTLQVAQADATGEIAYLKSSRYPFPAKDSDIIAACRELAAFSPQFYELPISIWPTANPALERIARPKPSFL